jgi:outer membrane protein assembly factor BamD
VANPSSQPRLPHTTWVRLLGIALLGLSLSLSGCKSWRHKKDQGVASAEVGYERANKQLKDSNFQAAVKSYEQVTSKFPFSEPAKQARIDLIYAYYRMGEKESAADAADSFIRENPTHPRVDYAYYMKGLIYFERSQNFLERIFKVNMAARPPQDARKSFDAFARVVSQYPQSEYAPEAHQRMVYIRNRLAEYNLVVARYYFDLGAYAGAIARAREVLETYDGAPGTHEALQILSKSYRALGMDDLARDSDQLLAANSTNPTAPTEPNPSHKLTKWWPTWAHHSADNPK